ncbi:MAG: bifunctional 4-hydroxy-2-oxoglutarate aldolase/2-dehydro-3-deoxy-phosphogluconate aldolase [Planctomycetota bacterium]
MPNRFDIVAALRSAGIVAVVRTASADAAVEVVRALAAGGVLASEITFTVPDAASAIDRVRALHEAGDLPAELVLGAGTVITAEQAHRAVDAGATYLVSPHTAPDVLQVAAERDVAMLPGALTPGEVFAAHEAGADIIKIFPAARMGPAYLKDLRGPYPDIPLMPTGGVSATNVHEWIDAGAVAVGVGSELVDKKAIADGNWAEITRRAQALTRALRSAREGHPTA